MIKSIKISCDFWTSLFSCFGTNLGYLGAPKWVPIGSGATPNPILQVSFLRFCAFRKLVRFLNDILGALGLDNSLDFKGFAYHFG